MYAIQTSELVKDFRRTHALRGVSMHVARGDIYGFIGKNGSGKSTTMKLIAGLVPPTSGEVTVLGDVLAPCEPHPRVGTLIESPGIYPNLSARDNLMTKALVLGLVDPEDACDALLRTVGLGAAGAAKARGFSMGMKQRLGLALALLGEPDVLLLDEPLNGLDPEAARDMRTLIMRLNRERGVTVVISSHVLDQLERMCTCYGVIRDGAMVRELTAQEVDEACASYTVLRCAEPARALALIDERMPELIVTVMPDEALRFEGAADTGLIGRLLMAEGIAIEDMHRTEGDVEAFFVELMGGRRAEDATDAGRYGGGAGFGAGRRSTGSRQGGRFSPLGGIHKKGGE